MAAGWTPDRVVEVNPARPCEVLIDGRWRPGLLVEWLQHPDGSWWGLGSAERRDWKEPLRYPDRLRKAELTEPDPEERQEDRARQVFDPPRPVEVQIDQQWRPGEATEAYQGRDGQWWVWGPLAPWPVEPLGTGNPGQNARQLSSTVRYRNGRPDIFAAQIWIPGRAAARDSLQIARE